MMGDLRDDLERLADDRPHGEPDAETIQLKTVPKGEGTQAPPALRPTRERHRTASRDADPTPPKDTADVIEQPANDTGREAPAESHGTPAASGDAAWPTRYATLRYGAFRMSSAVLSVASVALFVYSFVLGAPEFAPLAALSAAGFAVGWNGVRLLEHRDALTALERDYGIVVVEAKSGLHDGSLSYALTGDPTLRHADYHLRSGRVVMTFGDAVLSAGNVRSVPACDGRDVRGSRFRAL